MLRIWLCIFALLFASLGGSGLVPAFASGEACTQRCPDDDEHGQCSPDCADCTCCGHTRPVMLARTAPLLLKAPGSVLLAEEEEAPLSVDTDDILHVPIAVLA